MESWKSVKTASAQELDLRNIESEPIDEATLFSQLFGSLLQLFNMVRPNIAFAVGYVSRFMHRPTQMTWNARKHIVRYLSGTKELVVSYSGSEEGTARAFSNADWAVKSLQENLLRKRYCYKHEGQFIGDLDNNE